MNAELLQVSLVVLGQSLLSPIIIGLSAICAWMAQRWWHVGLGVLIIAGAMLVWTVTNELPEGAEMVWALTPLGLVAPAAWSSAIFALKPRLRGGPAARILWAVTGVLVGGAAGTVAGSLIGTLAVEVFQVSSFEGAAGYAVVFLGALPGLLIGAAAGLGLALRWSRRVKTN